MITEQHIQEQLSKAVVIAVAARAGMNIAWPEQDYGIDGTFRSVEIVRGKRFDAGYPIDFQLKASINCEMRSDCIAYDCEAATFNSLAGRAESDGAPCLLLVLCMPTDRLSWLVVDEEKITLKRCCYWYHITDPQVNNDQSKRILIPRSQLFTSEALTEIAARVASGQQP